MILVFSETFSASAQFCHFTSCGSHLHLSQTLHCGKNRVHQNYMKELSNCNRHDGKHSKTLVL